MLAIQAAYELNAPCAIRYPKTAVSLPGEAAVGSFSVGHWETLIEGSGATLLAVGSMVAAAMRVADRLKEMGISLRVINASTIKPLDEQTLHTLYAEGKPIFTLEEHMVAGGFGGAVLEHAAAAEARVPIIPMGVGDLFVQHGDHQHLLKDVSLDDDSILEKILHTTTKEEPVNG